MEYLEPLWRRLDVVETANLYDEIKYLNLDRDTAKKEVQDTLEEFTKRWVSLGVTKFTKKGMAKQTQALADSELFYHIILLYKCKDTPSGIPGKSLGGWFKELEKPRMLLNRPNYRELLELRNGELPQS